MKKILLFIPLFISCVVLKAQWNGATPIVTTSNTTAKTAPAAINDGNGNMIIAWEDARNSGSTGVDIYIQKINKDGTLPWGNEILICNAVNDQGNISLALDSAGGVIVAWGDKRANLGGSNDEQVYGQRVNSNGSLAWAVNGVNLAKGAVDPNSYRRNPIIQTVSSTEFFVVFSQLGSTTSADLFAQKCLLSNGVPVWSADVSVHGLQPNLQTNHKVLADGTGGIFIVWQDPRLATTNSDIFVQKINEAGALQFGTSGILLCNAANNQLTPSITSDGNGGLVAVWSDLRTSATDGNIYTQRINSLGTPQWAANGVLLCAATASQSNPIVVKSANEFVFIWSDPRVAIGDRNIYAQKVDLSGNVKWTLDGTSICTLTGHQPASSVFSGMVLLEDGLGGAFIVWDDARGADNGIYSQYINTAGAIQFAANGLLVSDATGNQRTPVIIADGSGGFITAWTDSRTSTNGEIYAARVSSTGTLPVTYASFTATKNTLNEVSLVWNIASEINTDEYLVERKGEIGDFATIGNIKAQKLGSYSFTDKNPLLGNNYYRIKAKDFDATLSYSDVRIITIDALNADAIHIYPNPTADKLNINISKAGKYQVKLADQSGKIVLDKTIELNLGVNDLGVSLSSFSSGVYYLILTNDFQYINKKIIKI